MEAKRTMNVPIRLSLSNFSKMCFDSVRPQNRLQRNRLLLLQSHKKDNSLMIWQHSVNHGQNLCHSFHCRQSPPFLSANGRRCDCKGIREQPDISTNTLQSTGYRVSNGTDPDKLAVPQSARQISEAVSWRWTLWMEWSRCSRFEWSRLFDGLVMEMSGCDTECRWSTCGVSPSESVAPGSKSSDPVPLWLSVDGDSSCLASSLAICSVTICPGSARWRVSR